MQKLTKVGIEQFANEVMDYLIKHELDMDVCIYYNNKRMSNKYNWRNFDEPPKLVIEENISPFDYFEYANYDHILSMSFEGPLYDSLNYSGYAEEGLHDLFEKYGVYWELGHAWNLSAYLINDDMEVEYTCYKKPKEKIYLFRIDDETPIELENIMREWYRLSEAEGDKGSCVIGAGFNFTLNENDYFMGACSPYQGSLSWEAHVGTVRSMLEDIGATNIYYDWGRLD